MKMEVRNLTTQTLKANDTEKIVEGYAVKWGKPSHIMRDKRGRKFVEVFEKGAFMETLEREDQRALWNHKTDHVLGRVKSNTLELEEDEIGLRFKLNLPNTQVGNDLYELVKRGDIDGVSFGFNNANDKWSKENTLFKRTITKANLYEISCVTFPAYPDSEVSNRNLEIEITDDEDIRKKLLLLKTYL